ncbi:MAG: S-layer homology domain-containing protein, partial [bacterium]
RLLVFICVSLLICSVSYADQMGVSSDLTKVSIGARSMGMGGVGVATSFDGSALFSNPARISAAKNPVLSTMQANLIGEININQIAVVYPTQYGIFGFGYIGSGLADIYPTIRNASSDRVEINSSLSTMSYKDSTFVVAYANELDKLGKLVNVSLPENIAVGANLKVFNKSMSGGNLTNAAGSGYDIDLGITYLPLPWLTVGSSIQNVLPASLGGNMSWATGAKDSLPSRSKIGGALKLLGQDGLYSFNNQELTLALDLEGSFNANKPILAHAGVEWSPISFADIRLGLDQRAVSDGSGMAPSADLTAGVGLNYAGIAFDYAYHQYDNLANATTHFFSLSYDFGAEKIFERVAEKEVVIHEVVNVDEDPDGLGLIAPAEKETVNRGLVEVKGRVRNARIKVVRVEKWKIPVQADGSYKADIFIKEIGRNTIEFIGHDESGNRISVVNRKILKVASFKDIDNHFAKEEIESLATLGVIGGYKGNTFKPNNTVTRKQAMVLLNRMGLATKAEVAKASNKAMTRAEAVSLIAKKAELSTSVELTLNSYIDISSSHWGAKTIAAAKKEGWLSFVYGEEFQPKKLTTRGELVYLVCKMQTVSNEIKGLTTWGDGSSKISQVF